MFLGREDYFSFLCLPVSHGVGLVFGHFEPTLFTVFIFHFFLGQGFNFPELDVEDGQFDAEDGQFDAEDGQFDALKQPALIEELATESRAMQMNGAESMVFFKLNPFSNFSKNYTIHNYFFIQAT